MSTPNFASILDESPDEVKAPVPSPVGTYICVVQGQPEYGKSSQKQTDFVLFNLRPISASEDVDEAELETAGGLDGKIFKATFYLTPEAVFMLDQFHEDCGIDLSDGAARRSRNEEVVNAQIGVVIKHETSQDGKRIFAKISRTLPVD